ncbi:MAG: bifunctional hydroxymethylpyrimidine kinase/phosphomethylpyrimidine kinase, partial [Spirochaetia bacterium]|nr:bifunctional hydroxymethylpyrimidine kinase/phosphomethylpyrimidine kinase [Spirochaetia bacterium]
IVRSQIRAVITDLPVKAAKTGMLFSKEIMTAFLEEWEQLKKYTKNIPLVVDPVMISTSGKRLIFEDAEKVYFEIFKTSRLITPNLPETSALLGTNIHHEKSLNDAAYELYRLSGTAVLVKGGHIENSNDALDVLYDGKEFSEFRSKMIESKNTHGTGCTLSAAIAAGLAMGMPLKESVKKGKDFVSGAILNAPGFGKGHGPLNHLWMHKGR